MEKKYRQMDKQYLDTIIATNQCTLKEYIYVYPRLLAEYKKLGEDCNEMYFIEEQIDQHFIHIDFAKKTQNKIRNDYDYKNYGTFEDWVKTVRSFDITIVSLKSIIKFLETKKSEPKTPQNEPVKPNIAIKAKKEFKDFFNPDVSIEAIQKIQQEFKDCSGKKMACLIYLLHKEFKLINYTINSKDMARIHFVESLKGSKLRMSGIDRYFELNDVKLENPKYEKDPYYIEVKEKLSKTID